jgi:hypothetical protein
VKGGYVMIRVACMRVIQVNGYEAPSGGSQSHNVLRTGWEERVRGEFSWVE